MALERIAAVQALVVGVVFAWAGAWKVFFPAARALAEQSALAKLLTKLPLEPRAARRAAHAAHLALGAAEIVVAAALLAPPPRIWAMRLATVFALGFLVYLAVAWRIAPDRPCACMGGRATRISRRSLARAAVLLVLTLVGWSARLYWGAALVAAPWSMLVVALEAALLWLLSPEFGWAGVRFERRLLRAARLRLDPTCATVALDWNALEARLRRSHVFQQVARFAPMGAPGDRWREGCSGYMAYHAVYQDRAATAIFAVPILYDPRDVTAAVVDAADETIYLRVVAADAPEGAQPESVTSGRPG